MTIRAASRSPAISALARRSSTSTLPSASHPTTTTCIPAMCALAGFVPWAEAGMRQMSRDPSPRLSWYRRMTRSPAYSPCEPALGWNDTPANAVHSQSMSSRSRTSWAYPSV